VRIFCANVDDYHRHHNRLERGRIKGVDFVKARTPFDLDKYSTPITIPPFKELRKYDPDIVHIHEPNVFLTTPLALYARYFLKKKVVMHNYSDPFDWQGGGLLFRLAMKLYAFLHKLKLRISDTVIVISPEYRDYARYFRPCRKKIRILPMCLSKIFRPLKVKKGKGRAILYVGRLDTRKGINYLIDAMQYIDNCDLYIVGSGEKRTADQLRKQARKINRKIRKQGSRVHFEGRKDQKQTNRYYNLADVLVLPTSDSTAETFGAVLIEAWATKTPVVAADNPAPRRLVKESGGGLLARRGNSQDLARKINRLLDSPKLAERMAEKGYDYVRSRYYFDAVADELIGLYKKLL